MDSDTTDIRARVLRGIAGNRTPGLHFPGYFLNLGWDVATPECARLVMDEGPYCLAANGSVAPTALAVMGDMALGTIARQHVAPAARMATIRMQMQFTGEPATDELSAEARPQGFTTGGALRISLAAATVFSRGVPVSHMSGDFVELDPPEGVTLAAAPWQHLAPAGAVAVEQDLQPLERAILKTCNRALARATPAATFIEHFWSGLPKRTANGARHSVAIGPHIGNRVGHVQGGMLLGIAGASAAAAAPYDTMLSEITAWYIAPGRGRALSVKSRVIHAGRTLAIVRTEIKNAGGERVIEAVSHHIARSR